MHRAEVNFKSAEIRQSVKRAEFGMREFHERSEVTEESPKHDQVSRRFDHS